MPNPPLRRIRISLLTSLLLTTIIALAIAIALLWREVGPLRHQVQQLQADLGRLQVTDADRPHVAGLPTDRPLSWKWRVYLPPLPRGRYHFNFFEGLRETFTEQNMLELLDGLRHNSPNYEFNSVVDVPLTGELTIEADLINREGHWFLQAPPFGEKQITLPDVWTEYGMPAAGDLINVVDKAGELAGIKPNQQMVFGRGDTVPLLLLQGTPTVLPTSRTKTPPTPVSSTLMLWIDYTPN
jgi:hypothetical protein